MMRRRVSYKLAIIQGVADDLIFIAISRIRLVNLICHMAILNIFSVIKNIFPHPQEKNVLYQIFLGGCKKNFKNGGKKK